MTMLEFFLMLIVALMFFHTYGRQTKESLEETAEVPRKTLKVQIKAYTFSNDEIFFITEFDGVKARRNSSEVLTGMKLVCNSLLSRALDDYATGCRNKSSAYKYDWLKDRIAEVIVSEDLCKHLKIDSSVLIVQFEKAFIEERDKLMVQYFG